MITFVKTNWIAILCSIAFLAVASVAIHKDNERYCLREDVPHAGC